MVSKIEAFADKDCTILLSDLGEIEVGENTILTFYVKNIGSTYLWKPEVNINFPGVSKFSASIPKELKPGQSFEGLVEFNPDEKDEGKKKGTVRLRAKSIGIESGL